MDWMEDALFGPLTWRTPVALAIIIFASAAIDVALVGVLCAVFA